MVLIQITLFSLSQITLFSLEFELIQDEVVLAEIQEMALEHFGRYKSTRAVIR